MYRVDLVRILLDSGFRSMGGTKHEKFRKGSITVAVKRHRVIDRITANKILKQAGIELVPPRGWKIIEGGKK